MSQINSDEEILAYLADHTYTETMDRFSISRMHIARVVKRNTQRVEYMPNKIKLAIVGVGNAASSLIQGVEYYKTQKANGILRPNLAGYHISDISIVAAFDISSLKVNKTLAEAIKANELPIMVEEPAEEWKLIVQMGPIHDGVIEETKELIQPSEAAPVDVAKVLKESGSEIVLCLLPSGADEAVKYYAEQALKAGCAFINATPSDIANNKMYAKRFQEAGLPLIGDDLQDQFGGTIVQKLLLQLMKERGLKIKESYALDVGGGAESLNTIHRTRDVKRTIKSMSVSEALNVDAPIVSGTSDYVPHLNNDRNSFLWMVGQGFLGSEVIMDIKIHTSDGPNAVRY